MNNEIIKEAAATYARPVEDETLRIALQHAYMAGAKVAEKLIKAEMRQPTEKVVESCLTIRQIGWEHDFTSMTLSQIREFISSLADGILIKCPLDVQRKIGGAFYSQCTYDKDGILSRIEIHSENDNRKITFERTECELQEGGEQ